MSHRSWRRTQARRHVHRVSTRLRARPCIKQSSSRARRRPSGFQRPARKNERERLTLIRALLAVNARGEDVPGLEEPHVARAVIEVMAAPSSSPGNSDGRMRRAPSIIGFVSLTNALSPFNLRTKSGQRLDALFMRRVYETEIDRPRRSRVGGRDADASRAPSPLARLIFARDACDGGSADSPILS